MADVAVAVSGPKADRAPTAGFLGTDWSPRDLPADTRTRNVVLRTQDGAATTGSLCNRLQNFSAPIRAREYSIRTEPRRRATSAGV